MPTLSHRRAGTRTLAIGACGIEHLFPPLQGFGHKGPLFPKGVALGCYVAAPSGLRYSVLSPFTGSVLPLSTATGIVTPRVATILEPAGVNHGAAVLDAGSGMRLSFRRW